MLTCDNYTLRNIIKSEGAMNIAIKHKYFESANNSVK